MSIPEFKIAFNHRTAQVGSCLTGQFRNPAMQRAVFCLMASFSLCGCATGLMSLPGAAMMADRFSGIADKDEETSKADAEKKDKTDSKREKEEDNDFGNRVDTPLLSEYMRVQGNTMIVMRSV